MDKFKSLIVTFPPEEIFEKRESVKYGKFKRYTYHSTITGKEAPVNVMLPPNYSEDKKYPVLYALHGYYNDQDWITRDIGCIDVMLSNLYADGDAKEMIVVSPYIFCTKEDRLCTEMSLENSLCYDNFINELLADLMPFIESSFSVATGRENTAITGFSMGGKESLFTGFTHPELFGYIGAACPAPGLVPVADSLDQHPGQLSEEQLKFEDNPPYLLLISYSDDDLSVTTFPASYCSIMDKNDTKHLVHHMTGTGHDHTSVRPHFYNLCRMIFN